MCQLLGGRVRISWSRVGCPGGDRTSLWPHCLCGFTCSADTSPAPDHPATPRTNSPVCVTRTCVCHQVLGVLAMIDSNETDWKVIVINVKDPNAARYNNITDVPQVGGAVLPQGEGMAASQCVLLWPPCKASHPTGLLQASQGWSVSHAIAAWHVVPDTCMLHRLCIECPAGLLSPAC